MCPGSGIKGRIYAFGEWIMIKPSKYYFDREYDRSNVHHLNDEHLVFRLSDYDASHINLDGDVLRNRNEFKPTQHDEHQTEMHSNRRRLASDDVYVQVYILAEETFVDKFKSGYSSNWFGKMVQYLDDVLAGVSAIYNNGNWGSDFGTFSFILAELNVVESNTGIYRPLSSGMKMDSKGKWELFWIYDAFGALINNGKLNIDWSGRYGSSGRIDQATIFVDYGISTPQGVASMSNIDEGQSGEKDSGTFCERSRWTKPYVVMSDDGGLTTSQTVYAHQFGHNFGIQHDGESKQGYANSCNAGDGVMSPEAGWLEWSDCSVEYLRHHFDANNGLQCLRNQDDRLFSNKNGVKLLAKPSIDEGQKCVTVSGFNLLFDGEWQPSGTYNGARVYIKAGLSLFWTKYTSSQYYWVIYDTIRNPDPDNNNDKIWSNGFCGEEDLASCGSKWYIDDGVLGTRFSMRKTTCGTRVSYGDRKTSSTTSTTSTTTTSAMYTTDDCISVKITNLDGFDGEWIKTGDKIYKKDGKYLKQFDDSGTDYWAISLSQYSTDWTSGYCDRSNVADCSRDWWFGSSRCGACGFREGECGAYTANDLSCLEDTEYQAHICVHYNDSVLEFELHEECANDKPMYTYVDEDSSYFIWYESSMIVEDEEIQDYGQWVLSEELAMSDGSAYCREENLLDCSDAKWITQKNEDDVQRWVNIEKLVVNNGACEIDAIHANSGKKEDNPVVFGVLIGLVVILVIFGTLMIVFCMYKRRKMTRIMTKEEVFDEEQSDIETNAEFMDTQQP